MVKEIWLKDGLVLVTVIRILSIPLFKEIS